jgi:hypothetical protein
MRLSHIFYGMYDSLFHIYNQKQMLCNGGRCRRENFPHHEDIAGASRADLQSPAGFGAFNYRETAHLLFWGII